MGAYLSAPVTDKESAEGGNDLFEYAVCAMQGWRTDMEDAHMVVLDMNKYDSTGAPSKEAPPTALFGVFDGHGGKEVARFCASHMPATLTHTPGYPSGDVSNALTQAFLEIDKLLVKDENRDELRALKGSEDEEGGGNDSNMTINSSQLPEALLEALGVSGDGGYVFKIVKSANGEMQITGDDEEEEEEKAVAVEGAGHCGVGVDPSGEQKEGEGNVEDAGAAGDSGLPLSPFPGANGKRKRAEGGGMDIDVGEEDVPAAELEGEGAAPRELVIEELSSPRGEKEWAGPNAGCTAVCAVVRGQELYVANAGDSRCVLSRSGQAVAMTEDHKPMDPEEYDRIIKAGGFVADGRVNGSLNLSRALGDLEYKQTKELPAEAQMVTACPEVRSERLQPGQDEFLILACDGIWDVLTNQEAVDFVRERLLEGTTPRQICEEVCDHCLAPDTSGCGKGCDNMSVVIALFKGSALAQEAAAARAKRAAQGSAKV